MLFFPHAKINIGLRILRKRPDGYHDLELSFFHLPELCDVLEITPADKDSFLCQGIPVDGDPEQNLVIKARNLIDRNLPSGRPPCCLHLLKKIPTGSGLGGGSSDATCTLAGLNQVFNLGFSTQDLRKMAGSLGADCAFFTQGKACIGHGKGDELETLQTGHERAFRITVVVPDFSVSTAEAYRNSEPRDDRHPLKDLLAEDIANWKSTIGNDFEKTLSPLYPQIGQIKRRLYEKGALYASLSGSGSAVFGLFDENGEMPDFDFPRSWFIHQSRIAIP